MTLADEADGTEPSEALAASRVAVVVASLGRPEELRRLLDHLELQTVQPELVILSVADPADLPKTLGENVRVLVGPRGSSPQRNIGIDLALAEGAEVVAFFDDDYVPTKRAIELFCRVLQAQPDVVGVTGTVLADGVKGPGIGYDEAVAAVNAHDADERDLRTDCQPTVGLYGCNMAFRASAIGEHRFDERLPLYAWQEDIDFSRQLLGAGRLVRCHGATGVHRGVKRARSSGFQFGWAQVVNPAYMVRKGTMPLGFALSLVLRNVAANHLRLFAPEPWIDRRGRVRGNWAGVAEVLSGRIDPAAVLRRAGR